jgi:hypothetical protein
MPWTEKKARATNIRTHRLSCMQVLTDLFDNTIKKIADRQMLPTFMEDEQLAPSVRASWGRKSRIPICDEG